MIGFAPLVIKQQGLKKKCQGEGYLKTNVKVVDLKKKNVFFKAGTTFASLLFKFVLIEVTYTQKKEQNLLINPLFFLNFY